MGESFFLPRKALFCPPTCGQLLFFVPRKLFFRSRESFLLSPFLFGPHTFFLTPPRRQLFFDLPQLNSMYAGVDLQIHYNRLKESFAVSLLRSQNTKDQKPKPRAKIPKTKISKSKSQSQPSINQPALQNNNQTATAKVRLPIANTKSQSQKP